MSRDPFNTDRFRRTLEVNESATQKLVRPMESDPPSKILRKLMHRAENDPASQALREIVQRVENGPASQVLREIVQRVENDPASQALREIESSSAFKAAQMLEQTDFHRITATITQAQASFETYSRSQQWAEISGAMALAHSVLTKPDTFEALQRIDQALKNLSMAANRVFLPVAEQIQSFSLAAAQAVQPSQDQFNGLEAWQTSLATRMAGLQTPWANEEHFGVSVVGFARIARLHDISIGPAPFHPASGEIFEEELGEPVAFDENHTANDRESMRIDAGLNAEIVTFPTTAYPDVLFSAGFELRIEAIAPVRTENGDQTGRFDPQHSSLFWEVENRLRELIEVELKKLEGESWLKRRVNEDIRKKCLDRKNKDHEKRGDSYPLIFYADFMDLAHIICDGKNWRDVFNRFFTSKNDFEVAMNRLSPVRNSIGHNRPLVKSDQITLMSEGYRILNAIGVKIM